MNNITATLPSAARSNGKNLSCQKEMISAMRAVAAVNGKMREVVVAPWKLSRALLLAMPRKF